MKSVYNRMTNYRNETIMYRGRLCDVIYRANIEQDPYTKLYRISAEVRHFVSDYKDKICTISERLKEGDEWYMVWSDSNGQVWK